MKWRYAAAAGLLTCALWSPAAAFGAVFLGGAEYACERVYDQADLWDEAEEKALSAAAEELSEETGMDFAVVTTEDSKGYSGQEYADRFFDDNGMGTGENRDGALFLIDMDNREIAVSTSGEMIWYMPDGRVEAILDEVYGSVADGAYYEAAQAFLKDAAICFENGIAGDTYQYDSETEAVVRRKRLSPFVILAAFGIALACGGGAVFGVMRSYGSGGSPERMASNFRLSYRKDSALRTGSRLRDAMVGTYVTKQMLQESRKGGGSGGLSSGGRATTHRTGGRTHGGGSRKF